MQVVWTTQKPPDEINSAIFLAGPTPRDESTPSWRPEFLRELESRNYDGVVFVPEWPDGKWQSDYDDQVQWEAMGLRMADVVLFWVPRDMNRMPALTTNVEWGMWYDSGKAVFGAPPSAPKNDYLRYYANQFGAPVCDDVTGAVDAALGMIGEGAVRVGGERNVPLFIWKRAEFQNWYRVHRRVGHRLDDAELVWHFEAGSAKKLFCWVLRVSVYIPEEQRHKSGELFLTRMDSSSVLAYRPADSLMDHQIVLVKEFRSAAASGDGYVWELPGGSSFDESTPEIQASEELAEETGVTIDGRRFRSHGSRQNAATLLTHHTHLFSVELTDEELESFRRQEGIVHGVGNSERTTVHVRSLRDWIEHDSLDWSQLGMILSVLAE